MGRPFIRNKPKAVSSATAGPRRGFQKKASSNKGMGAYQDLYKQYVDGEISAREFMGMRGQIEGTSAALEKVNKEFSKTQTKRAKNQLKNFKKRANSGELSAYDAYYKMSNTVGADRETVDKFYDNNKNKIKKQAKEKGGTYGGRKALEEARKNTPLSKRTGRSAYEERRAKAGKPTGLREDMEKRGLAGKYNQGGQIQPIQSAGAKMNSFQAPQLDVTPINAMGPKVTAPGRIRTNPLMPTNKKKVR